MKFKLLKTIIVGSVLSVSALANAGLIQAGIQTSVTQGVVDSWGWTECHRSNSNVASNAFKSQIETSCDGDYVMMGAWDASLGKYGVIGSGEANAVFQDTHANYQSDDINNTLDNWSNGLNWYRTTNYGSWGFTTGSYTTLSSADVSLGTNGHKGLSWHLHGGTCSTSSMCNDLGSGWAYSSTGNSRDYLYSAGDQRVFWTTSVSVPEPSTLAIFALGMIGLASRRFKKQS
jgi:hypothetical protein